MINLPLVDYVVRENLNVSLDRVRVIGVQHILGTTHSMLRSLYKLGLKPENISLIGKCYSTNPSVLAEMQNEGIDVSEQSLGYDSHESYDQYFDLAIKNFLDRTLSDFNTEKYDRIIAIDDGGHFIQAISSLCEQKLEFIGIEQTTSGLNKIKDSNLMFPVISVANSEIKHIYETPMIAKAIEAKLLRKLSERSFQPCGKHRRLCATSDYSHRNPLAD